MEVCENKNRNNGWIRVIILIALGVLIAIGGALRTEAAELNHRVYEIIHTERNKSISHRIYSYDNTNGNNIYSFCYSEGTKYSNVVLYGYEQLSFNINELTYYELTDGSINVTLDNTDNNKNNKYTLSNGTVVYVYGMYRDSRNSDYSPIENIYCDYYDFGLTHEQVATALERVIVGKAEPDIKYEIPTEEMDIALVGFECNEYLEASWTGVTGISDNAYDELYVEVKPSYLLLLEEGEQLQEFEKPDTIKVPFLTYAFSNTYDYYFANNPYAGRAILTLKFTPVLSLSGSNPVQYRGKTIEVRFDVDGNYGGYDVPIEGLNPQYKGFEFTNFRVSSLIDDSTQRNAKILCGWDGFSLDNTINYVYRDVKVEIYCYEEATNSWKWLEYPNGDLYMGQGRLDLWMREMYDYASTKGMLFRNQKGSTTWLDCQIRLTPYYKTYTEYMYGKSILITTTGVGGIKSYEQSTSDVFNTLYPIYEDLREDYQKDNSVIGDFMDNIINGSDGDGEELNLDDVTFNFFTLLKNLLSACGQFPALFAAVFSFLPDYFVSMLVLSFSLIIILRVIGR